MQILFHCPIQLDIFLPRFCIFKFICSIFNVQISIYFIGITYFTLIRIRKRIIKIIFNVLNYGSVTINRTEKAITKKAINNNPIKTFRAFIITPQLIDIFSNFNFLINNLTISKKTSYQLVFKTSIALRIFISYFRGSRPPYIFSNSSFSI